MVGMHLPLTYFRLHFRVMADKAKFLKYLKSQLLSKGYVIALGTVKQIFKAMQFRLKYL